MCLIQVLKIINPEVTNKTRDKFYLSIIVSELTSYGFSDLSKDDLETAVKNGGIGLTNDSRYFLCEGVQEVPERGAIPKALMQKKRCCSIEKRFIQESLQAELHSGNFHYVVMKLYP